jgi:hypothetical protein
MRKALNIIITDDLEKRIKKTAKQRGFSSVGDYIKMLILENSDLVSEEELMEVSKSARKDFKNGKLIKEKSLDDF